MIPVGYLILILAATGLLSLLFLGVAMWSSRWPENEMLIMEFNVFETEVKGQKKYSACIKYQYFYGGNAYFSNRFSLLGSRLFDSKDEIQSILLNNKSYVCPLFPRISFVYFERRLVFSLTACFLLSLLMILVLCWL